MQIACPKCKWEPDAGSRWVCGPGGCGHSWNTFETMGRCPACHKQWKETSCHACLQWSPHLDWYHDVPTVFESDEIEASA